MNLENSISELVKFEKTRANLDRLLEIFREVIFYFFKFELTKEWQDEIAREIFLRVLSRKRHTIVISLPRQVGKTETVIFCIFFLMYVFPIIEGEPLRICITAPEKDTSSEFFGKLKRLFDHVEKFFPRLFLFVQKSAQTIVLPNGSRIDVFGLFKGFAFREEKKTTKEGRTFHITIRDEMHLGDDSIFSDEIEPAMATTGGVDIWLGNGGFRQCEAKKMLESSQRADLSLFRRPYDEMKVLVRQAYERTKNELFRRWGEAQEAYISKRGESDELVRKNLFLEWIVEIGNFTSPETLLPLGRESDPAEWKTNYCDVGIDWGKETDRTVLTITDYNCNVREWALFRGDLTEEQCPDIRDFLQRKQGQPYHFRRVFSDSTGAGDPVTSRLRKLLRIPVHPVVFTTRSKDILGKIGLATLKAKEEDKRLSYPKSHEHAKLFEGEMLDLEKEYRGEADRMAYHHPKKSGAHDDFPDSLFLSLYGIVKVGKARKFEENVF